MSSHCFSIVGELFCRLHRKLEQASKSVLDCTLSTLQIGDFFLQIICPFFDLSTLSVSSSIKISTHTSKGKTIILFCLHCHCTQLCFGFGRMVQVWAFALGRHSPVATLIETQIWCMCRQNAPLLSCIGKLDNVSNLFLKCSSTGCRLWNQNEILSYTCSCAS